jgi:hypothetical protein
MADRRARPLPRLLPAGLVLTLAWLLAPARVGAQAAAMPADARAIYTCVDDHGRRITADRPIADCLAREQRVLNSDGSLRGLLPPTLSADERAEKDARERRSAEARTVQADLVRRDRNLMQRYANEAAHNKAREASLDTVRLAIRASELRLRNLATERKPLIDEADFYKGRTLPPMLKAQLDANDASVEATRSAAAGHQTELGRITQLYDAELDRLKKLWGGAVPGSLGPIAGAASAAQPASPTASAAASAAVKRSR